MGCRGCLFVLAQLVLASLLALGWACGSSLHEAHEVAIGAGSARPAPRALQDVSPVRLDGAPARARPRQSLLERLVLNSERIAVAKVARVVEVRQRGAQIDRATWPASEIPVALLELERVLLGPQDEQRLIVVAAQKAGYELEMLLEKGERALVFLETSDTFRSLHERTRAELTKLAGPVPLRVFASGGLWKIDADGAVAIPEAENVLPEDLAASVQDGKLRHTELMDWSRARIAAAYPWVSAGDWLPYVRVEASRDVHSFDRFKGTGVVTTITPSQWTELWSLVQQASLHEMPRSVGQSRGPEGSHLTIEVHTLTTISKSTFVDWNPTTDYERGCMDRARPLWDALMKLREQP